MFVVPVIKELGAKGLLSRTLLGMVAMADAYAIFLFGMISAIVATILTAVSLTQETALLAATAQELFGSLLLGAITGAILIYLIAMTTGKSRIPVMALSAILFNSGFAQIFHFSPLLVNLTSGFVLANLAKSPALTLSLLRIGISFCGLLAFTIVINPNDEERLERLAQYIIQWYDVTIFPLSPYKRRYSQGRRVPEGCIQR